MNQQIADYELAFNEISHALLQHGQSKAFWKTCDVVEDRLIEAYPEDETAIIELVATWLVKLGVAPEGSLQGMV